MFWMPPPSIVPAAVRMRDEGSHRHWVRDARRGLTDRPAVTMGHEERCAVDRTGSR
jgi:hypothetical protein